MATALSSQLDPVGSALDALAVYFESLTVSFVHIRGPQEFPEDYDGSAPVLSLVALSRDWEEMSPERVGDGLIPGDSLFKVAQVRIQAQMDLWVPYRFTGDIFAAFKEQQFHNRLPWKSGLELVNTGYWSRPMTVSKLGAAIDRRDPSDVVEGLNRRVWELEILTDLVVPAAVPEQASVIFQLSTELGPDTVTEPDHTVPAA